MSPLQTITCGLWRTDNIVCAYLCCVRVRQRVCVAVGAEADEGDSHGQQTQEERNPRRIVGDVVSKVGHRLPETHFQTSHPASPELQTQVIHFSSHNVHSSCGHVATSRFRELWSVAGTRSMHLFNLTRDDLRR